MGREMPIRELIGCKVKVINADNPSSAKIEGAIADETRNMLVIHTKEGKRKRLIKAQHTFEFQDRTVVQGSALAGRPEERIKRWLRKST